MMRAGQTLRIDPRGDQIFHKNNSINRPSQEEIRRFFRPNPQKSGVFFAAPGGEAGDHGFVLKNRSQSVAGLGFVLEIQVA
jgi:hypothetical protein